MESGILAQRLSRKVPILVILSIVATLALLKKRARDQLRQCLAVFLPGLAVKRPPGSCTHKLKVRVVRAHDLRKRDATANGNMKEPSVFVRVGQNGHKLPTAGDDSCPTWTSENLFTFGVNIPSTLEIEVMTKGEVLALSSVGRTQVELSDLKLRRWLQYREELQGNVAGAVEFELRLDRA